MVGYELWEIVVPPDGSSLMLLEISRSTIFFQCRDSGWTAKVQGDERASATILSFCYVVQTSPRVLRFGFVSLVSRGKKND